jgi:thiol-disulfide isomerase/thioredoxin
MPNRFPPVTLLLVCVAALVLGLSGSPTTLAEPPGRNSGASAERSGPLRVRSSGLSGPVPADTSDVRRARAGDPVPGFEVEGLRDSTRTLGPSNFEGRYVLLNLWATWCAPCLEKIPALQKVRTTYEKDRLALLNISFDRSRSDATEFLERRDVPGMHAYAGIRALIGPLGKKFARTAEGKSDADEVASLPALALVAPDGTVIASLRGGEASEVNLVEMLDEELS